jgi:hypothetical protein
LLVHAITVYFLGQRDSSRHRQFIKDFLDDRFAGLFLGLGFVGDGNAEIILSGG